MDPALLAVKLSPPTAIPAVARPRLVRRLLDNAATPLTLVCAPVGWGKTSLLVSWMGDPSEQRALGWVSLDPDDDEPTRFWRYLIAAVRKALPNVGAIAAGALTMPGADPIATALPALLNDLATADQQAVVVLDDYHVIAHPAIHEAVEYLLTYLPPALRLVVASRHDPPLPLARMRARGQLTELRAEDLRFQEGDVAASLAATLGQDIEPSVVADLSARTEGWPAAVHLAGLAVRGEDDPTQGLRTLPDDHRDLTDLLVSEVLEALPSSIEDALVRTSILTRLSASLCSAVLGRESDATWLHELERSGMPLAALDHRRRWYRLHPVVRRVVRQRLDERLSAEAVASLHANAAAWFTDHGEEESAIGHLLAGGHDQEAATHLLDSLPTFGHRGALGSYARLGNQLPPEMVRADARLAVTLAWGNGIHGAHERAQELAALAVAADDGDGPAPVGWRTVESSAAALRASFLYVSDSAELYRFAARAAELENDPALPGYAVARAALGYACMAKGESARAIESLEAALSSGLDVLPAGTLVTAGLLAAAKLGIGDIDGAQDLLDHWLPQLEVLEAAVGDASAPATNTVRHVAGQLARLRGDLTTASAELERAVTAGRVFGVDAPLCYALVSLAEIRALERDRTAARKLADEARELAASIGIPPNTTARLDALDQLIGRTAQQTAVRSGAIVEQLTDRELSILRAMQGNLSLRELGAELYLSHNTVKGYARILHRKLGVHTRADAVSRGRDLGLI